MGGSECDCAAFSGNGEVDGGADEEPTISAGL